MDLNEQVARRRSQLAEEGRAEKRDEARVEQQLQAREKEQRTALAGQMADDLAAAGVPVAREGEEVTLVTAPAPLPNIEGVKRAKLKALLNREARRRWTPGENWLVISLISAGIALAHLAGLGLILVVIGFSKRASYNDKHRARVLADYPQLKEALG